LAKALIPATRSTSPMVDASLPFIHQLRLLVRPSELGGLSNDLRDTIPALTRLTKETIPMLQNQVRPASSCVVNVIYPWSQLTLNDPNFNAHNGFPPRKVYVEGVDFLPGLAGESRDFDANGYYIRVLGALGSTGVTSLTPGLVGGTLAPLAGAQPKMPKNGQRPPFVGGDIPNPTAQNPKNACENQPRITDLTTDQAGAPAQYSATSPLPPALTSILQSVPPLPGLPLSRDVASRKKNANYKYTPLTAAQKAAARKLLLKFGLWERFPSGMTTTGTNPAATSRSAGTKASTR
jgi:hypothetical protein